MIRVLGTNGSRRSCLPFAFGFGGNNGNANIIVFCAIPTEAHIERRVRQGIVIRANRNGVRMDRASATHRTATTRQMIRFFHHNPLLERVLDEISFRIFADFPVSVSDPFPRFEAIRGNNPRTIRVVINAFLNTFSAKDGFFIRNERHGSALPPRLRRQPKRRNRFTFTRPSIRDRVRSSNACSSLFQRKRDLVLGGVRGASGAFIDERGLEP